MPEQAPATGLTASVAVIGVAGRFPGADGIPEFWRNLTEGRDAVREFASEEMMAAGVTPRQLADPARVKAGAVLDGADLFDADFFRTTARDAALMDPQHRLFLTCAWEAMEDAGLAADGAERTGVFASCSISTYLLAQVLRSSVRADETLTYPILMGNDKDFLATRVSYKLGLTGPSMNVQTACSSSLTAVHLACASLERGECDTALVGGASITVPQTAGYPYQEGGILSRDGHCRVFDSRSDGTVKGNGCGVVVLKPLDRARTDGDRVYAVIRGTAVNNDGSAKIGYAAPGPAGQESVVRAALEASGVRADHIGYVETHGTGTALGDPLELNALAAAHRSAGGPEPGCAIGSVKAVVGHLDAAAGVTGLIKAALVLHHRTVPPQANFTEPNPRLRLDSLPYSVPTAVRSGIPVRAAAVSSFGLGGTNVHCVLTAAPPPEAAPDPVPGQRYPVVLSARDDEALATTVLRLHEHLSAADGTCVRDLAYTLAMGRTAMARRYAFSAADQHEVLTALRAYPDSPAPAASDGGGPADAFVRGWLAGRTPPWTFGTARKVPLPPYPLRPVRHWVEADLETAAGSARTAPEVSPADSDTVLEQVVSVLEKHLGVTGVLPEDDYFDLGGDSMLAVEIATSLRGLTGVSLDLDAFGQCRTPRRMAAHICDALDEGPQGEPATRGTIVVRPGHGRPLFLVHPAGGTNLGYFRLVAASRGHDPVSAVTFPTDPAAQPGTLRELAALYVEQIRAEQPHGPYRLAGYSFGGNVVFEMALQLRRAGERVAPPILIDSYPPECYVGGHIGEEDFDRALPLLLRAAAVTVDGEQAGLLRRNGFDAIWRHNHELLKGYYPDRRLEGDIILLRAEEDEDSLQLDEALGIRRLDKTLWRTHVGGGLRIRAVPGSHFTMFQEGDRIRALAAAFDEVLSGPGDPNGQTLNRS
ncbi:polyketide synthase [Streptomyces blattellae]|uniref:polyketide synthase n=1 Tax=Streptomyces blattellae TaxID=2569855 RepID=UPI0012B6D0EC|nr:polyketide synthase [Streptomyces blattellae]